MSYKQLQTFFAILYRDARVFQQHIISRFIDACIWAGIVLYVSQYIMPKFGIAQNFGLFIMVGNVVAWGMFEVATNISILLADIKNNQSTSYYLSLPVPHSWTFFRIGLMDAYKSFISTLPMIPLGKLILDDHFILSNIAIGKFITYYILSHVFFGFFGLFIASLTTNLHYITTIKLRVIFPMWFIGGYQFSWYMLYQTNPWVAYANLLNPTIYIMEGMRSTILDDPTLLPFSTCILVTIIATLLCMTLGIHFFKKRLDCI